MRVPQIIHFKWIFHYKPSILGYPHFWKAPYKKYVSGLWIRIAIYARLQLHSQEEQQYKKREQQFCNRTLWISDRPCKNIRKHAQGTWPMMAVLVFPASNGSIIRLRGVHVLNWNSSNLGALKFEGGSSGFCPPCSQFPQLYLQI